MTTQKLITFINIIAFFPYVDTNLQQFFMIWHIHLASIWFFALLGWINWFYVNILLLSAFEYYFLWFQIHYSRRRFFSHKTLEWWKFIGSRQVFIRNSRGINFAIDIELLIVWQKIVCSLYFRSPVDRVMYNEHFHTQNLIQLNISSIFDKPI